MKGLEPKLGLAPLLAWPTAAGVTKQVTEVTASGPFTPPELWSPVCPIPHSAQGELLFEGDSAALEGSSGFKVPPGGWAPTTFSRCSGSTCGMDVAEHHPPPHTRGEKRVRWPQGVVPEGPASALDRAKRSCAGGTCERQARGSGAWGRGQAPVGGGARARGAGAGAGPGLGAWRAGPQARREAGRARATARQPHGPRGDQLLPGLGDSSRPPEGPRRPLCVGDRRVPVHRDLPTPSL